MPWEHAAQSLPPDFERFAPLMAGAVRRFPFLADAEAIRLVCHPDAMTPDANPLVGPMPGLTGFWVAAGLSLNGFGGAGGLGQALAGWITAGDPGVDIVPVSRLAVRRHVSRSPWSAALARETYADYYRLRFPYDADVAGRPRRLSAVHGRLQEAGAVFGTQGGLGAAPTTSSPADRGAGPAGISAPTAGAGHRGSSGWATRCVPCASVPASSISPRSARSTSAGPAR